MRTLATAAAVICLVFSANYAFAESESDRAPFSFSAEQTATAGPAFVADANAEAYPAPAGNAGRASSLAQLEPAAGSETMLQTASSLPVRVGAGSRLVQARPASRRAG